MKKSISYTIERENKDWLGPVYVLYKTIPGYWFGVWPEKLLVSWSDDIEPLKKRIDQEKQYSEKLKARLQEFKTEDKVVYRTELEEVK